MLALSLLFFILFSRSRSFLPNRYGELQAANIDPAFMGETVLFTCVITDDSLPVNSSAIWIRRSKSNTSVGSVVNRTATSATIEVKVMSLSDAGVYYCTLTIPGEHLDVTFVIVAVEYPLAPVTDLNCTVSPGSTKLECEYTLPRPYLYPDAIVGCVFYHPRNYTELQNICYNGTDRNFSLSEGHDLFTDYIFEIRLQYNGRKVAKMSKNFSVAPMEVVIPPPVENVRARERRATRLQLSWKDLDVYIAYIYRVTYTAVWGNEKQISTVQTNSTTILLRELSPFTNYSVLVQGRERHLLAGYWSQGDPVTVRTLDDVPGSAPRVSPAVSRTDGGSVVVYWQPLSPKEENGEMQGYRIQCGDEGERHVGPGAFSETLDTPTDRRGLWCDVYAVNSVGRSPSSSLYIPSRRSELTPRDFWVVGEEGDTNITFFWDAVGREQHNCAAYWCQAADQSDICQTPVQWETVTCDQQSLTLDTGHVITDQRLMVGSSEELSTPGGLNWSPIKWQYCIYAPYKVPPVPDEFRLSPNQPPLGVHVVWRPPDCRQKTAHITNYIVSYCLVPTAAGNCSGELWSSGTRVVDGDAVSYLISDLEPGADYKVNIRAVSQVLQGPWSTPVIGRVEDAANPLKIILAVTGCFIVVLVTSSCFIVVKRARSSWTKGHTYWYPPLAPDEARVLLNDHGPCSRVDPGQVVEEVTEDGGPVRVVQEVTEDGGPVHVVQEVTEDGGPVHVVQEVTEDGGPVHVVQEVTEDGGPVHGVQEVTEDGGPVHVVQEVTEDGGPVHVVQEVTEDGGPVHGVQEVTEDGGPVHVVQEVTEDGGDHMVIDGDGGPGYVIGEVTEDNGGPGHVIGEVTEDNGGPGHVIGEVTGDNGGPGHVIGEVTEDNGGQCHVIGEDIGDNGGPGHVKGEVTEDNGGPGHVKGEVTEDNGGPGHVIEEVIVDKGGAGHLVGEVRNGGKGTVGESEPQTPNGTSMHLQNDHVSANNSEYVFDMTDSKKSSAHSIQSYSMVTLREQAGC
ncbi:protogenin-like [Haliotis cracherodii]|uniref:protogenin-like n=1 Tax=Haliotis cracherodii TaxID=6455 RepID=UPI0039EAC264